MFRYKFNLWQNSPQRYSYLLSVVVSTLAVFSSTLAVACPETNSARIDYQSFQQKSVLETSDGRKYSCWWDKNAEPITFEESTYGVVIRCSETLTVYTHLDSIYAVVIENDGVRSGYEADFLGDRYECDTEGQTMIKSWVYKGRNEVVRHTIYLYNQYKW
ncbi:MAG: hypothetical protein WA865_16300 [Spirulinaceae cyanobacterium]